LQEGLDYPKRLAQSLLNLHVFSSLQGRGWFNEAPSGGHNRQSFEIQKVKDVREADRFLEHRTAISGIAQPEEAGVRGGIMAEYAMSAWRQKLAHSVYLAAIATAMVGWIWALLEGLEWALGV
jgi:hypothetical protein